MTDVISTASQFMRVVQEGWIHIVPIRHFAERRASGAAGKVGFEVANIRVQLVSRDGPAIKWWRRILS